MTDKNRVCVYFGKEIAKRLLKKKSLQSQKVYPEGNGRDVYRIIEISGRESLDRLCGEILSAYDFIDKLGLEEKQKFSLHYDFGDDWMFVINVQKIVDEKDYQKPKLIKSKGNIEQYPDWDEDDDYEDD